MSALFSNFEVGREPRWPLVLKLLVLSAIFHTALAATVWYLPPVREALNLAVLAGKTGYVDRPYTKTAVGENLQMIDPNAKFQYPPGYFAIDALIPMATPTPDALTPKIIAQAARPEPSPSPSPSASPSPGGSAVAANAQGTGSPQPGAQPSASPSPTAADQNAEDNSVLGVSEDEVNTRPLKDWLTRAYSLREKGLLDLNSTVEMTVEAKLSPECKLVDPVVVQKSGDRQMIEVAKDLTSAISDSRMLLYLKDPDKLRQEQGSKNISCEPMPLKFAVKLDQTEFAASVETDADTPDRAASRASAYNWSLALGQFKKKGHDEEVIFKNTKVTSSGKQIKVHFNMPRQTAGDMLKKQVETKPSGD